VLPYGYLANIADYVTRGGALLAAAGPAFASPVSLYRTPLANILPSEPTGTIYTQGFRPDLTETGRRHPVTAGLPGGGEPPTWGRWFRMIDADPMRGNVLMSGVNGKPVLILDRVGDGRVAQLMSDHAWLWARGFEGGGPQAEMLRRVAHWLMKEPDLEEEDLRAVARGNRLEIERRSLTENGGTVAVTMPSGHRQTVALKNGAGGGTARASLVVGEPGLYRLSDGTLDAVAAVGAINPKEFTDLRAKPETMAAIAEATGGGLFWLGDRAGIPDFRRVKPNRVATGRNWIGLRANRDYVVTGVRQVALLPAFVVLLLALGGLLAAWQREGR